MHGFGMKKKFHFERSEKKKDTFEGIFIYMVLMNSMWLNMLSLIRESL